MAIDANTEIRRAVDTGKVVFGQRQCQKELLKGNGELVIFSNNIPANEKEKLLHITKTQGKNAFDYKDNGLTLGSVCGKPFVISTLIIIDKGKSKVLDLIEENKTVKNSK
ncbi:MAG: 50S ribosomal protein L30e [Candidatus ainarchaeum sp.]|nr:50S ribosomal protein L30e [Candidatus ainarchaeum sp.]